MSNKEAKSTRNKFERVVLLVDMDCFYCQVEEKLDATLKGCPIAVVQYNAWRGGGIIAVNYAARAKGVTRHMRGDEAKAQCPEIKLVQVPNVRGKADLSKYRDGGQEVANVLQKFTTLLERASVDEAYLDITASVNERLQKMNQGEFVLHPDQLVNTYAVGYETIGQYVGEITTQLSNQVDFSNLELDNLSLDDETALKQVDIRLLLGASIANEIRAAVKAETQYECSAGIAHNKIVAKLACGMNKPNKQTILPLMQIPKFFDKLPLNKIKGLGGKFGEEVCERCQVTFLGQLRTFTEKQLQNKFDEKNGTWLFYLCRGFDFDAVTPRFYSKSIGCCKRFPGLNCISGLQTLTHWLGELAGEISDRLEKDMAENKRKAKQMVVSFTQDIDGESVTSSRTTHLNNYEQQHLTQASLEVIRTNTKQFLAPDNQKKLNNSITFLGISVGKFETISRAQNSLQDMFAQQKEKKLQNAETDEQNANKIAELAVENEQPETETKKLEIKKKVEQLFKNHTGKSQQTAKVGPTSLSTFLQQPEKSKNNFKRKATEAEDEVEKRAKYDIEHQKEDEEVILVAAEKSNMPATPRNIFKEYAEFAVPSPTSINYITCEECHCKVANDELSLQTHRDRHFAFKLSQQLREELSKAEISKKLVPTPTSRVSSKAAPKAKAAVCTTDISKFLKVKTNNATVPEEEDEVPSTSALAKLKCEKCHQFVLKSEMPEHLDYHVAKELQRELNAMEVQTVVRKDANNVNAKKPAKKLSNKPITQFLTKPKS